MRRPPDRFAMSDRRAVLAGGAALTLAGCGGSQQVDDEGRVRIRFATDRRAHAGHGGFYQALAGGAYVRRGLNVQIVQGRPGVNVPQALASGSVELGYAASSFVPMNLVAEGAPVKAVAAFFQKDPQVLMAHPDESLTSIADLSGRPIQVAEDARDAFWIWVKARYGFTDAQLSSWVPDPAAFIADPTAVRQGELTSDPFLIERQAGFQPRVFLLADEGYPSYGAMVLAPNAFARDNARALRAFLAASAEGWRDYLQGDATAADALIRRDNPAMAQDVLTDARARLREDAVVSGGDAALYGLGTMTPERWKAFYDVATQGGVYPPGLNWREAFTTQYLPGRG